MSRMPAIPKPAKAPHVSDDYLDLVRKFPLRPLRLKNEHAAAKQMLDHLVGRPDLTPGQRDYLAALARFVRDYEREQATGKLQDLTPLDILRHLMKENDLSTTDLGHIVGSRGLASEILNGKRGLSKRVIIRLAQRFRVSPSIFLERN
jgi:HTH-type transcriptional regulator / antitoxin HigA